MNVRFNANGRCRMIMPVTLADIARELGVSKMTVSRAINNNPLISADTRERVLEVARRMSYQPNQHARADLAG